MGLSHAGGVDKRHVQSQWLRPIPELLWPARMSMILKFYSRSGDSASAEHAPTSDGSSRPNRRSSCAGSLYFRFVDAPACHADAPVSILRWPESQALQI